jgi:Fe2+ transport system protein B
VERISKYAFGLEAALLTYPTFLGLMLVAGSLLPVLTGAHTRDHFAEAAVGVIVLAGLICGWRLALSFLFAGRAKTRQVPRLWWFTASAIGVASVLVLASSRIVTHNTSWAESPFGILEYGVLFVPSYIHLTAEVWLRAV